MSRLWLTPKLNKNKRAGCSLCCSKHLPQEGAATARDVAEPLVWTAASVTCQRLCRPSALAAISAMLSSIRLRPASSCVIC